jgi:hypothetical protein
MYGEALDKRRLRVTPRVAHRNYEWDEAILENGRKSQISGVTGDKLRYWTYTSEINSAKWHRETASEIAVACKRNLYVHRGLTSYLPDVSQVQYSSRSSDDIRTRNVQVLSCSPTASILAICLSHAHPALHHPYIY